MANTRFQHKRSTVSGVTPTTGDIAAGELGINLADRKLFTSNGSAIFELGANLAALAVSGNVVITGSANAANVTAALFTGNVTGTASNATNLNSQPSSFYTNATNLITGTLPDARLSSAVVNTTGSFTLGGNFAYNANLTIAATGELIIANGAGIQANGTFGTEGQILSSNGTGVYWATASGGGGTLQAVASGSLSDGTKVIVNANGTVSAVGLFPGPPAFGSKVVYNAIGSGLCVAVYDSANAKVVVSTSNQVWVGTVSGTSISFGSPVTLPTGGGNNLAVAAAAYDSNAQKIVFICTDFSVNHGYAVVGTVSGSSISFGTPAVFQSNPTSNVRSAVYDPINQVVVFSYSVSSANQAFVQAASVSGTDVTFGSSVVVHTANIRVSLSYDTNAQKVVAAYVGASNFGRARVCTVSGTSISLGNVATFNSATTSDITIVYDPNSQTHVIGYRDGNSSNFGRARTATVSGTGFSFFGNALTLNSADTSFTSSVYDPSAGRFVLFGYPFNFGNPIDGLAFVGTVSGTNIVLDHVGIFNAGTTSGIPTAYAAFDSSTNRVVLAYSDPSNSSFATARVMETATQVTNLTNANFIGVSSGTYTNGQTATIQTVGSVDDAQSGLTAGLAYYVQGNGALSTTAGAPVVFAGTALSANNLLIAKTLESSSVGTGAIVREANTTLSRATLNDGYTEEVFAITDGATVNLDPNNGSIQTWTLGANRTPNQANWASGQSITLLVDDGSAFTITWTTLNVVWKTNGGNSPTLQTTGVTVIALWKVGTTIYGARVGDA